MAEEIILIEGAANISQTFPIGKINLFKIGQKRVAVVKTKVGFKAFDQACPHLGYPLSQGHLNFRDEIVCPWHNMMFSLTSGEEIQNRCGSLEMLPVEINEAEQLVVIINKEESN